MSSSPRKIRVSVKSIALARRKNEEKHANTDEAADYCEGLKQSPSKSERRPSLRDMLLRKNSSGRLLVGGGGGGGRVMISRSKSLRGLFLKLGGDDITSRDVTDTDWTEVHDGDGSSSALSAGTPSPSTKVGKNQRIREVSSSTTTSSSSPRVVKLDRQLNRSKSFSLADAFAEYDDITNHDEDTDWMTSHDDDEDEHVITMPYLNTNATKRRDASPELSKDSMSEIGHGSLSSIMREYEEIVAE